MFSGEIKYKSRILPLLALKIELRKEVILLGVPYRCKTVNDNPNGNDTVQ